MVNLNGAIEKLEKIIERNKKILAEAQEMKRACPELVEGNKNTSNTNEIKDKN